MELDGLGLGRMKPTVVVLGAGATRGASFTESEPARVKPPLDRDFFLQLKGLGPRTNTQRSLLEGIERDFGPPVDRSMETIFSQLVASDEISSLPRHVRGRPPQTYQKLVADFLSTLVDVFAASVDNRCEYHDAVLGALQPGDSVISFNYDCLADFTLARLHGTRSRFDPARSYGVPISVGIQYWGGPVRRALKAPIQILKLHGSLNWNLLPGSPPILTLRQNPYSGSAAGRIIPPIAAKRIQDAPFNLIWAEAREALATARALVVIGYSAAQADVLAQALIRLHLSTSVTRGLEALVLVNPTPDVRSRLRGLCSTAMRAAKTRLIELESLRDLAGTFP